VSDRETAECHHAWPNTHVDHDMHECCLGDRCWRKSIHECWCGATVEKESERGEVKP
jgi:hypothetical protein